MATMTATMKEMVIRREGGDREGRRGGGGHHHEGDGHQDGVKERGQEMEMATMTATIKGMATRKGCGDREDCHDGGGHHHGHQEGDGHRDGVEGARMANTMEMATMM